VLPEVKSTNSTFAAYISRDGLEELAGEQYFERGLAYFRAGAVSRFEATENEISARVTGTRPRMRQTRLSMANRHGLIEAHQREVPVRDH
jgi:uncharacterized Zn finger protein